MYVGMIKTALEVPGAGMLRKAVDAVVGPGPRRVPDAYGDEWFRLKDEVLARNPALKDRLGRLERNVSGATRDSGELNNVLDNAQKMYLYRHPSIDPEDLLQYRFSVGKELDNAVDAANYRTLAQGRLDSFVNGRLKPEIGKLYDAEYADAVSRTRRARAALALGLGVPAAAGAAYYALKRD